MHAQDTPHPNKTEYRGRDWSRIEARWRGKPKAAVGGPAAVVTGPRLGSSTHFAQYKDAVRGYAGPQYLATLKGFGPNGAELILRTVHEEPRDPTHPREHTPARLKAGTPRIEADPINVQKSAWRARSDIRSWMRMMCTPDRDFRLVTLAKRGGLLDHRECVQALGKFRKAVERSCPGTAFIAVPEMHLGGGANHGTFHIHCVMVFQPGIRPVYGVFHRLWWKALGGTGRESGADVPGNCDFARTHAKDGTRYTACQAARYLSKYVSKQVFGGNVGQKRFTTSHGAPDPVKRYWWEPIDLNHSATRSRAVQLLRAWFPARDFAVFHKTFSDGGDTYHVFSAEPVPRLTG